MSHLGARGLRHRLVLVVVVGATVTLVALTVGFNLVLVDRLDRDARNLLRARTAAQLQTLSVERGRLTVGEAPDDGAADNQVWVYGRRGPLERPRGDARNQRAADAIASGPGGFADVAATDTLLYAAPVLRGGRVGTLVAGVSLAPYERSAHTALITSIVFATLILLGIVGAAHFVIGSALRPVVRMTEAAEDWSEHDLDHRFALGPPHDELTGLAATFDRLLDRLAASLRHEQRFSAELSHELRTPLASLLAETELALRRPRTPDAYRATLKAIQRSTRQMNRTLETLISAARADSAVHGGTTDGEDAARRAIEASHPALIEHGVRAEISPPAAALRVGADGDVVERILAPLIENGARHAATRVRVGVACDGPLAAFTVADDGPGVPASERARIFEPGVSQPGPANGDHRGAGLGLALARRLARAAGGDVECLSSDRGALFQVRLPRG